MNCFDSEKLQIINNHNSTQYTLLKAAEEAAEFLEVNMKLLTKKGKHLPDIDKWIGESADLYLRIRLAYIKLGLDFSLLESKVSAKIDKLIKLKSDYSNV